MLYQAKFIRNNNTFVFNATRQWVEKVCIGKKWDK